MKYIVDLVRASRTSPSVTLGVSPRGGAALLHAAKAWAFLAGRDFVSPDEVKAVAKPALRHRLQLRPEVELEGGTADGVLWYAAGPDARASLEEAITQAAAGGEADDRFFRLAARPGATLDLLTLLDRFDLPDLFGEYRAITEEVLKTCDDPVRVTLKKVDAETVVGTALAPQCLLRLAGRALAKFSQDEGLAG